METLREQFKKAHPQTIGEKEKAFDDSNYIDWLENEVLNWSACNKMQKKYYDELEKKLKSQTLTPESIAEALPSDYENMADESYKKVEVSVINTTPESSYKFGYRNALKLMRQQAIEKLSGKIVMVVPPTTTKEERREIEFADWIVKQKWIEVIHQGIDDQGNYIAKSTQELYKIFISQLPEPPTKQ